MNDSELENYFYIACYHYAKTIGPNPTITDTNDFVYLINDGSGITIAEWNHSSVQPTNTVLKTYSVDTILNTWNAYIKENTNIYKIDENNTFDISLSGPWLTNKTITIKYVVSQNIVSMNFPTISYTSDSNSNPIISTTPIKISIRPTSTVSFQIIVENNSNKQFGCVKIDTSGYISIYIDANKNNFSSSGNSGFEGTGITYNI